MNKRGIVASLFACCAAACGYPDNPSKFGSCFAASDVNAGDVDPNARSDTRTLVRHVDDDERTEPGNDFDTCALGMPVVGEFIDDGGARVWLALEAELASEELVPREILRLVDNATLVVEQRRGWNTADSVFLTNGDQPILAMQSGDALRESHGALTVEDNGAAHFPTIGTCGTSTTHSLRFIDDNGTHVASNGETRELIVGGREFLATNAHSIEFDWQGCTDGPFPAFQVTWIARDNSL